MVSLKNLKTNPYQTKRGDTIIEVMFAIAVFCLVAVISISMMNTGVAQAENALEVVVTRNELNAQAEALRFVHAAYNAERTLPEWSSPPNTPAKYQIYSDLWNKITQNAIDPSDLGDFANLGDLVVGGCEKVYDVEAGSTSSMLSRAHAFVLNTRDLNTTSTSTHQVDPSVAYISSFSDLSNTFRSDVFSTSPLNARLVFYNPSASGDSTDTDFGYDSSQNRVLKSEGIWVIAVKGGTGATLAAQPEFYDFYIQSCWQGPNGNTPQSIDTVIRLYNPEGA